MPDILTVEPHETPERVHARLAQVRGPQVFLHIPRANRALRNRVALAVLARRARARGLELVLVTRDGPTRALAHQVGLPVRWTLPRGVSSTQVGGAVVEALASWGRWLTAFLLLAVGVALGLALLPHATVELVPASQPMNATLDVVADPQVEAPDAERLRVPARRVEVTLQRSVEEPTQAHKSVPDLPARGVVRFMNQSDTAVTIPAGSVVFPSSNPDLRFLTLNSVRLPARAGSRVSTPIRALEPGPEGNLPAFAIDTLDPALGLAVAVVNERPTEGGTARKVGIVTAEERARVRDALLSQLRQQALDVLATQLQPDEELLTETAHVRVVEERYDQEIGVESDVIGVQITIQATALAVAMGRARDLAVSVLRSRVPAGYAVEDESIQVEVQPLAAGDQEVTESAGAIPDTVRLRVRATAVAQAQLNRDAVRRAVLGRPLEEVRGILEREFALAAPPTIRASQTWLGRMPWLPLRIDVVIRRQAADG